MGGAVKSRGSMDVGCGLSAYCLAGNFEKMVNGKRKGRCPGGGKTSQPRLRRAEISPFFAAFGTTFLGGEVYSILILLYSYAMDNMAMISHLRRLFPLWCLTAPPSPR